MQININNREFQESFMLIRQVKRIRVLLLIVLFIFCCSDKKSHDEYKAEVMQTELAFAQMAHDQGIGNAFFSFADKNAVLNRNNNLLKGADAFRKYFDKPVWKTAELTWRPDFIDVSESGDLAYSYGKYVFKSVDSTGTVMESKGVFHTVWKRQRDGTWKFVWD